MKGIGRKRGGVDGDELLRQAIGKVTASASKGVWVSLDELKGLFGN